MKFKFDFVTNSSSTAFIVFWPQQVHHLEDVSKYIKRKDFADTIYNDITNQTATIVNKSSKSIMHRFIQELSEGYTMGEYHYDETTPESFCKKHGITEKELFDNRIWYTQMFQEQEGKKDQHYITVALDLMLKYEGQYAYFFEYGDEGGEVFWELESKNDWGGLPHVKISKH